MNDRIGVFICQRKLALVWLFGAVLVFLIIVGQTNRRPLRKQKRGCLVLVLADSSAYIVTDCWSRGDR